MNIRKRFTDPDYRGYFIEFGERRLFTVRSGVRYVDPLPIVVQQTPTATGSCQELSSGWISHESIRC